MNFHPTSDTVVESSPIVISAWRTAGKEARFGGRQVIQVADLVIGVFSLDKLPGTTFEGIGRKEYHSALEFLSGFFVDPAHVRRGLRCPPGTSSAVAGAQIASDKIQRSEAVKELFRKASESGQRRTTVFHLLREVLDGEPDFLDAYLSTPRDEMLSRLNGLCEEFEAVHAQDEAENSSLALSIDACAADQHPGLIQGAFTRLIYDIPEWVAVEDYAPIAARLLEVFAKADSAGVILLNERGELLLKSGHPAPTLRLSLRLVRQVIETKHAQIWIREDCGQSSMKSASGTASAMYVPILSGGTALGAVFVGAVTCDASFTEWDLKQASAIARQLGTCFENQCLRRNLEQQNRILQRLLTNFSPGVRDKLLEMAMHGKLRLGGVRSEVSILCSDIRGFTSLSNRLDAEDLVELLNDYFSVTVDCIFRHGGTVDKFVGDAILAVFGSPVPDSNHRLHAAEAALAMQAAIADLNRGREQRGLHICKMGIGIHCGDVLHGFVGSRERMEYTVIGETVNITSRLCDGAAGSEIVISRALHEHLWRELVCQDCEIATKHEGPMQAYRLLSKQS